MKAVMVQQEGVITSLRNAEQTVRNECQVICNVQCIVLAGGGNDIHRCSTFHLVRCGQRCLQHLLTSVSCLTWY